MMTPPDRPPGSLPPGSVPPWPVRYPGPPPGRDVLILARVMLGLQWLIGMLGLVFALLDLFRPPTPGVPPPSLARRIVVLLLTLALVASTFTAAFWLGPSRRLLWWLALVTQIALAVMYGWAFTMIAITPSPEGMAAFSAVIIGPLFVSLCVIGLIALLLPSSRSICFAPRVTPGTR